VLAVLCAPTAMAPTPIILATSTVQQHVAVLREPYRKGGPSSLSKNQRRRGFNRASAFSNLPRRRRQAGYAIRRRELTASEGVSVLAAAFSPASAFASRTSPASAKYRSSAALRRATHRLGNGTATNLRRATTYMNNWPLCGIAATSLSKTWGDGLHLLEYGTSNVARFQAAPPAPAPGREVRWLSNGGSRQDDRPTIARSLAVAARRQSLMRKFGTDLVRLVREAKTRRRVQWPTVVRATLTGQPEYSTAA